MATDLSPVTIMINGDTPAKPAFHYLVAHARAAGFRLIVRQGEVRSVELQWPDMKRNPFSIQAQAEHLNFYLRQPVLNLDKELVQAAVDKFGAVKPNSRGEYWTHIHNVAEADVMLQFLRERGLWPSKKTDYRFVSETFSSVTANHFLRAARRLASGDSDHPFKPSTQYDLLFDGRRLPPKAVFGVAASEALGFPVKPENFSAGESMTCFSMLRASGYEIVKKSEGGSVDPALISDEDRSWAEGSRHLVTHLRRERGAGLAQAKRESFRSQHGRLFCERCNLDPIDTFGSELGEACIEVHHRATHVAEMADEHLTRLEDLQCLCANCHRFVHRELKAQTQLSEL